MQQPQTSARPAPAKANLGQAGSQEELDDYNRLHAELDAAAKKNQIDDFANRYPDSGLLAYVYQEGVYLGRQLNRIDMMAEYGEKSLILWPGNYTLLTELASAYVQRNRVEQAGEKAKQAIDLVTTAVKPAHITEEQWAEEKKLLLASNYTTLGFMHLRRAQASSDPTVRTSEAEYSVNPFERALEYVPADDYALYGLGYAWVILNEYRAAESNLAKAVAVGGIIMASARRLLEEIYRSRHDQTLDGLDQVIAKAKADLGISGQSPSPQNGSPMPGRAHAAANLLD